MSTNINIFIGILILGVGEIIYAKIVLKEHIKVSTIQLGATLLLTVLLCTITNIYLTGIVKTLSICLIHVFEFKYLFKLDYIKSIFLTLLYVIMLLLPEIITVVVSTSLLDISKNYFYNTIAEGIIGNILVFLLFVIEAYLLRNKLNKLIKLKLENKIKIVLLSGLTFICVLIVFYNAFGDIIFNYDLIISIFVMAVFICILLILIQQTVANNNLVKKYEQILEFMTTYEDEVENQRVLRHETKNAFLTIKAQITDKASNKEMIDYIDSILKDDTKMKNEEYAKFKYLPPNGIKGLCYFKIQEAQNKGLTASINISARIKNSSIYKLSTNEMKELGKILGVFLDNAIEASLVSKNKIIAIEGYIIDNEAKLLISNSYEDGIDITKIGQNNYTTKGKNRGHGLLLVKNIVNNNRIFKTETTITPGLYTQSVIIKRSTK